RARVMMTRVKTIGVPLAALVAAVWISATSEPVRLKADTTAQEQDPRQATFVRMCSTCHEAERVATVRESQTGWTRIVNDMMARGAQGSPEDARDVIAYLAEHFGPSGDGGGVSLRPARPRLAVTGAYQARCGACHGEAMTGGSGPSILGYIR